MGRKPRVEFKGAIFHVIKRGNNREYIFRAEEDKDDFLKYLDHANVDGVFNLLGEYYALSIRSGLFRHIKLIYPLRILIHSFGVE